MTTENERQYQKDQRTNDTLTKILIKMGEMEVRAQERHDGLNHHVANMRQVIDGLIPRREVVQLESVMHKRIDELKSNHETLVEEHDQLRRSHELQTERQTKIIGFATVAGTGFGGVISVILRKLGIIS